MARYLGIDVGGTAARWHVQDCAAGTEYAGAEPGFSGHLFRPEILRKADEAITALASKVGPVDRIVAGITGMGKMTPEAARLTELLTDRLGTRRILVMNDVELAVRSVFEPGDGILVYAGTGSIGAHIDIDGVVHVAGGKGVLIDDAGGGYWIATRALRQILRKEDREPGSGWRTILGKAIAQAIGGSDWTIVRQSIYGRERGDIGMLALPVAEAARKSDDDAVTILTQAGAELARLALGLEHRIGRQEIALTGRAAGLHPLIGAGFAAALPGRSVRSVTLDTASAAARMAASRDFPA